MESLDIFPKTLDDFKERTLGGGAISVLCVLTACCLIASEWSSFRSVRVVERLAVDTSSDGSSRMLVNLDIYLPSLPCSELTVDVTDHSGLQQIDVTKTLHKLRMDRHGVPIDIPQPVHWNETVAPAFQQRKVVSLMEDARAHLLETLAHYSHEEVENPDLSKEEHAAHRRELAEQSALLQGRLDRLAAAAEMGEESEAAEAAHLQLTIGEVHRLHASVRQERCSASGSP